jgi:hypothetical protein
MQVHLPGGDINRLLLPALKPAAPGTANKEKEAAPQSN